MFTNSDMILLIADSMPDITGRKFTVLLEYESGKLREKEKEKQLRRKGRGALIQEWVPESALRMLPRQWVQGLREGRAPNSQPEA